MKKAILTLFAVLALASHALAHEHHPPHQGTLVVLGEEFAHLELVLDHTDGTLSAYALDGEAENAEPLDQSLIMVRITFRDGKYLDLALRAVENPLTGETVGHSSEFRGQSNVLRGGANEFAGTIEDVQVRGADFKNVAFDFPEGNDHD